MYKVIDIIEKKVPEKSTGIYVGEDYVGYTCVVMKKSNIKIEGKNLTIKDPSKGHKTIIKPHYPADGRSVCIHTRLLNNYNFSIYKNHFFLFLSKPYHNPYFSF